MSLMKKKGRVGLEGPTGCLLWFLDCMDDFPVC